LAKQPSSNLTIKPSKKIIMNRKNFIKKSLIAGLAGTVLPASAKAKEVSIIYPIKKEYQL